MENLELWELVAAAGVMPDPATWLSAWRALGDTWTTPDTIRTNLTEASWQMRYGARGLDVCIYTIFAPHLLRFYYPLNLVSRRHSGEKPAPQRIRGRIPEGWQH